MWQKTKNYYHLAQALLASVFYGFPSRNLIVIGITGTDGKTTTANMIYHLISSIGEKVSIISSINAIIDNKKIDTGLHVTTPNPWQIQKFLKDASNSGSKYFILEATSHGLDQNRLAFVNFNIAVLTNISEEHLDYHKDLGSYIESKAKLFKGANISILNYDDKLFPSIAKKATGKIVKYGLTKKSEISLVDFPFNLQIKGDFNISNALAAAAVAKSLGYSRKDTLKALNNFKGITGRLEQIDQGQDFQVFIDFAHTPNGLKNALKTLTEGKVKSRLIVVFGSAGERDKSKRAEMGSVASKYADIIVLTSEDPRSETPIDICSEIKRGIRNKKPDSNLFIVTDRQKAINLALKMAKKDDIVGIFGKGHEKSMSIGKKEYPWSDFSAVKKAIGSL